MNIILFSRPRKSTFPILLSLSWWVMRMGEQVSHTYGGRTKIYLFFHQRGPVDWHPVHRLLRTKTYLYLIRGDQLTGTGNLERFLVKVIWCRLFDLIIGSTTKFLIHVYIFCSNVHFCWKNIWNLETNIYILCRLTLVRPRRVTVPQVNFTREKN